MFNFTEKKLLNFKFDCKVYFISHSQNAAKFRSTELCLTQIFSWKIIFNLFQIQIQICYFEFPLDKVGIYGEDLSADLFHKKKKNFRKRKIEKLQKKIISRMFETLNLLREGWEGNIGNEELFENISFVTKKETKRKMKKMFDKRLKITRSMIAFFATKTQI